MKKLSFPLDLQLFAEGEENSGVETVPAAEEQEIVQDEPGVETTEVAAQIEDEKDFAAALKAREAKLREQIEKEYSEKYQSVETRAQMLDRIAKFYGYDNYEDFQKAFEQAERDQLAKEEAARLGMDEELYRKYLQPVNQKLKEYEETIQMLKQQEMQRQIEAEVNMLKSKYPDFEEVKEKVFDLAIQKGYTLEDAYILSTYQDKIANIGKEKEQEVLANIMKREEKQVLPSSDKPGDIQLDPEKMSLADIEEISRRVRRGERITFN